jgi:hypothetical protein
MSFLFLVPDKPQELVPPPTWRGIGLHPLDLGGGLCSGVLFPPPNILCLSHVRVRFIEFFMAKNVEHYFVDICIRLYIREGSRM